MIHKKIKDLSPRELALRELVLWRRKNCENKARQQAMYQLSRMHNKDFRRITQARLRVLLAEVTQEAQRYLDTLTALGVEHILRGRNRRLERRRMHDRSRRERKAGLE